VLGQDAAGREGLRRARGAAVRGASQFGYPARSTRRVQEGARALQAGAGVRSASAQARRMDRRQRAFVRRQPMKMRGLVACLGLLAWASDAHAADKQLTIAIYAPNAPFESGTERFAFINRLAQQVTSAAGVPAVGKAFA